ncbi:GlxA family transcriptional regulator [Mesorhizobium sp. CA8]|uniref:GlxA family transcriptional regulator n=1 Tax=unclassified Mesorhizobium TaxID=325217 RepID=UPI001CCD16B3|nr:MULTISPECIES: GlxA family transcriptional regulator [unclassified Mesorhizobium]MBZ9761670.1 GlxA family transcriptional regulator [Mesorhizobium sp. CA8]MBZ9820576.1 GlxA family transcriptional regulator [Mesorhizobium sp. CA4]
MNGVKESDSSPTMRFGFLFIPGMNLASATMSIDVLRVANRLCNRPIYEWSSISEDGAPVEASNHLVVKPDFALSNAPQFDFIIVCASFLAERAQTPKMRSYLRKAAYAGSYIGGIGTGSYVLADAGLLDGYRCTIHWENLPAFTERYPDLDVTDRIYEIDRKRITCGGGSACLDLFLHITAAHLGTDVALEIADQMLLERIRTSGDFQRKARIRSAEQKSGVLASAVKIIESNLEQPLSIEQLASRVSISQRQLERLFHREFSMSPSQFYTKSRLNRARTLLTETALPVSEIMVACGFGSQSNFSRVYRHFFGHSPTSARRSLSSKPDL